MVKDIKVSAAVSDPAAYHGIEVREIHYCMCNYMANLLVDHVGLIMLIKRLYISGIWDVFKM